MTFFDGVDTRTGFSEWACYPKCLFLKDENTVQKIEMDVWKSYIINRHLRVVSIVFLVKSTERLFF